MLSGTLSRLRHDGVASWLVFDDLPPSRPMSVFLSMLAYVIEYKWLIDGLGTSNGVLPNRSLI